MPGFTLNKAVGAPGASRGIRRKPEAGNEAAAIGRDAHKEGMMEDPGKLFVDERLTGICVYCGTMPDTRDHCPSKVLLDEPYPPNLPVVEACLACNKSFSLDEQYLACFLECVMCGSTGPKELRRENIKRILSKTPRLAAEIQSTVTVDENGGKTWHPDMDRVRNVVLKLARGHLHFELGVQELDDPDVFEIAPLSVLTAESREFFECPEPGPMAVWPELGSRAFLRALPLGGQMPDGWLDVQEGRYRYLVGQGHGNYAHIVIGEYLACRVAWG
ncbi:MULTISPECIES: hypothetical protein [unclassified Acidovorax]|uniref:hypothetical protein n=1 Tax=unclassified Acidovorax TaxID=2684926 RepID=UPI001C487D06|nr:MULTISPECIES: hypothetical protein [unclassified Acidovorax]MBV7427241.1 hypothetical protein [Acidovorax sp. sif0732]MBV7448365.1 hypothetical protein [Acidovorax sp. sif0715]